MGLTKILVSESLRLGSQSMSDSILRSKLQDFHRFVGLICLLSFPAVSGAVVFEVTNAEEFQAALTAAASNGGEDQIVMNAPSFEGNFYYFAEEEFDLSIRPKDSVRTVTLDAQDKGFGLYFRGNNLKFNISLERLIVRNANNLAEGGAIHVSGLRGVFKLNDVDLTNNYSASFGAAIYCDEVWKLEVLNSSITRNLGSNIVHFLGGSMYWDKVEFEENDSGYDYSLLFDYKGLAGFVLDGPALAIQDSLFRKNSSNGALFWLLSPSLVIENSMFDQNEFQYQMVYQSGGSLQNVLESNRFVGNVGNGYLIELRNAGRELLFRKNRIFGAGNDSGVKIGQAGWEYFDRINIEDNLFVNAKLEIRGETLESIRILRNTMANYFGAVTVEGTKDTTVIVQNNILKNLGDSPEIRLLDLVKASQLLNNIVDNAEGFWISSENNIALDPLFFDEESFDFHLSQESPGVNAGSNEFIEEGTSIDLDGNPRIEDGTVDIGAYERSTAALHPADANGDRSISQAEFNAYNGAWRTNEPWSSAPEIIPVDFVTRAGYLLQKGGAYKNIGVGKPATWVPVNE